MQQKDMQMDIIAEYYMVIRDYSNNERYSGENSRVYTSPDSDAWLVLERKGENAIQARLTDETGVIVSWDDYAVKNADIQLMEAVRLSVSGRSQVVFTPLEELVIDRYGDYDRNTTRGKLDILSGRFKDPDIEAAAVSVTQKLGRISDQSYADMYAVGQRRQKVEKGRSLTARMERAKVAADKHNAERAITPVKGRRGMEI
ncbi:MAG: hypothetical protein IJ075_05685 [Lachnospiraceae bacterium]|nr:hypothetical protein [Lachnospiraceae bacterium]